MAAPRLIFIGLDSLAPAIAFADQREVMPCFTQLAQGGVSANLRSTDPPVTVPAWVTMTSGRDPGELGIYGFRNRVPGSYGMRLVAAQDVAHPRLWDLAAAAGLRSSVVSVPLTYPPVRSPLITMASCFLTPEASSPWIEPAKLRGELLRDFGPYIVDVDEFRTAEKERLLGQCSDLTRQHFGIFRRLIERTECELAMLVDIAPDRLHHGMLSAAMSSHEAHDPDSPLAHGCRRYYALLDQEIERTVALAGPDTRVMIVSDHGVQPLRGSVCVNEWLIEEGYLVLDETPSAPVPLGQLKVDWSRTRAWGEGGYHSRIMFNVQGREPRGIVDPQDLPRERGALIARAEALTGPGGEKMTTKCIVPHQCYARVEGLPPDLLVYWDELALRSAGTVGHGAVHIEQSDIGPDEANHHPEGVFVLWGHGIDHRQEVVGLNLLDAFVAAADSCGLELPAGVARRSGRSWLDVARRDMGSGS